MWRCRIPGQARYDASKSVNARCIRIEQPAEVIGGLFFVMMLTAYRDISVKAVVLSSTVRVTPPNSISHQREWP